MEFTEVFGQFMPSRWSRRGGYVVDVDYDEVDGVVSSFSSRSNRRVGAVTMVCASAFLAWGGLSQPVQAKNIAAPGHSAADHARATDVGEEKVSGKHMANVVEFVRRAPRSQHDLDEPESSF